MIGLIHLQAAWTTALVLCAETSYLETETRAVGQVILNRVADPAYPDTILGVVLQRRQFAPPSLCRGAMRKHHWTTAQRMFRQPHKRMASWRWLDRGVLSFATLKAWRRVRPRWRKSWEVAGLSKSVRRGKRRVVHVFLRRR